MGGSRGPAAASSSSSPSRYRQQQQQLHDEEAEERPSRSSLRRPRPRYKAKTTTNLNGEKRKEEEKQHPKNQPQQQQQQQQVDDIATASQKFKDYLSSPSCALPKNESFQSILTHVILSRKEEEQEDNELQVKIGQQIVLNIQQSHHEIIKYDALLRFRLSNLIESLNSFLLSNYEQSFYLLSNLLSCCIITDCNMDTVRNVSSSLHEQKYAHNQRDILTISNLLNSFLFLINHCDNIHYINLYTPKFIPMLHLILFIPSSIVNYNTSHSHNSYSHSHHLPPLPSFDYSTNDDQIGHSSQIQQQQVQNSDSNGKRNDNSHSNSLILSQLNNKLVPIRKLSLTIIQQFCIKAPKAILPFWSLLFPIRSGISKNTEPQRQTIAYLLLYDPNIQIRLLCISLSITLITLSAKPILLNYININKSNNINININLMKSFIPISERILNTCIILISVIATALKIETEKTILPKLTKLINEILLIIPNIYIPIRDLISLLNILKLITCGNHYYLHDIHILDKTIRSATAKSLTIAITCLNKNNDHKENEWIVNSLNIICTDIISCISNYFQHIGHLTIPIEELLGVLKSIISINSSFFALIWEKLQHVFIKSFEQVEQQNKNDNSKLEYKIALHIVRILEMYLSKLEEQTKEEIEGEGEAEENTNDKEKISNMKQIGCEAYCKVLKLSENHPFQSVRVSSIVSLDYLLRILSDKIENEKSVQLQCVNDLCEIIVSDKSKNHNNQETVIVKASAVKALGSLKVDHCQFEKYDVDIVLSTLNVLFDIIVNMNKSNSSLIIARALTSFVSIIENNLTDAIKMHDDKIYELLSNAAIKARQLLVDLNLHDCSNNSALSANEKGQVEMCRSACIQMITTFITITNEGNTTEIVDMVNVICEVTNNTKESINIRCISCKCLGRIAIKLRDRSEPEALKIPRILYDLIGKLENGRIEGSAAKCICEVLEHDKNIRSAARRINAPISLILKCGKSIQWSNKELKVLDIGHKDRGQFLFLQKRISELICNILFIIQLDNESARQKLLIEDAEVLQCLTMAICWHFDLSKYLTDVLMKAKCIDDVPKLLHLEKLTQDVLPNDIHDVLERLFNIIHVL